MNFLFCSSELSSKFSAKVRMTIRGFLSESSVEQRVLFRRIFALKQKFSEISRQKASVYCLNRQESEDSEKGIDSASFEGDAEYKI